MVSLCMIVKNEVKLLESCINSVKTKLKGVVNEFVVVDTGSTDGTKELAKKLGCTIYDFEWVNDFAKARNFSISKAKNDWVLVLDADEVIETVNKDEFKALCTDKYKDTQGYIMINNLDSDGNVFSSVRLPRLYNRKLHHYEKSIHETLYRKVNGESNMYNMNMIIKHTGYTDETYAEKHKVNRNKNMIQEYLKNNPNDIYMTGQLGITYKAEGDYDNAILELEKVIFNNDAVDKPYYANMVCEYLKILIQTNQNKVALVCENLWDYCSYNDEYVYCMGIIYLRNNQGEKAINAFLYCINKTGDVYFDKKLSYRALAEIFEQIGQLEQSLIWYKQSGDSKYVMDKIKSLEEKLNK